MQRVKTQAQVREQIAAWRGDGARVALVPTMGNLHRGHFALLAAAAQHADKIAVSVFVNPLQFDRADDLTAYPRTLDADLAFLREHGAALVFTPDYEEMYPPHVAIEQVDPGAIGTILCGADRPGHFAGVATVVVKLFRVFTPDVAVFGEKDYQQLVLIRQLVQRFDFDIHVLAVPTVREDSGLALSSRNTYLDDEQKRRAPALYRVLRETATAVKDARGAVAMEQLTAQARRRLEAGGLRPDYVEIRNAETLAPVGASDQPGGEGARIVLGAAHLGKARLIDNVRV